MTPKVTSTKIVKLHGEWIVRAYVTKDGRQVKYPPADYFTTNKTDAQQTASKMVK